MKKIAIWGAGAIGGSFAFKFAEAKLDVTVIDTDTDHIHAIKKKGLTITGPIISGTQQINAYTVDELVHLNNQPTFDFIYLAVKGQHTNQALEVLKPYLAKNGVVISLQNGLLEPQIANYIGSDHTIGCFINFGADYIQPGEIHYGGRGTIAVGEITGEKTARIEEIHNHLSLFDQEAILTDNIFGYLWGKLGYGALLFASATTQQSIADFLSDPRWLEGITQIAHEVMQVAQAENIDVIGFNGFDSNAFLEKESQAISISIQNMSAHNQKSEKTHSGIWRDLNVRKRQTEVDAFNQPILALAKKHQIKTPFLNSMVLYINKLETGTEKATNDSFYEVMDNANKIS